MKTIATVLISVGMAFLLITAYDMNHQEKHHKTESEDVSRVLLDIIKVHSDILNTLVERLNELEEESAKKVSL